MNELIIKVIIYIEQCLIKVYKTENEINLDSKYPALKAEHNSLGHLRKT